MASSLIGGKRAEKTVCCWCDNNTLPPLPMVEVEKVGGGCEKKSLGVRKPSTETDHHFLGKFLSDDKDMGVRGKRIKVRIDFCVGNGEK